MDIKFYDVNSEYIEYLKSFETKARGFTCVPNIQYANRDKFFYGAVIQHNGINYFVPVSHTTKPGNNTIILTSKKKTSRSKPLELGSLRFQYMIPVPTSMLKAFDFNAISDPKRKRNTQDEYAFCKRNRDAISKQAQKTYDAICKSRNEELRKNACDFEILERAYIEFCKQKNIDISNITLPSSATEQLPKLSEPAQNLSALQAENAALKKTLAETTEISEKRAVTIRTTNAVLSANPELKKAFVEEKRKLLQQPTTSQKKPSAPVPPQQPKKGNKPKH